MTAVRPSNALGDVILTAQLSCFLYDWLRQRQPRRGSWSYQAAFWLYAVNLLAAAGFTTAGAALHIVDPLPQQATPLWLLFLMGCVSTPVLFPSIVLCALYPKMSTNTAAFSLMYPVAAATAHAALAFSAADLSRVFPVVTVHFAGHVLDGRSLAGAAEGLEFDLISSVPNLRGDGLFVHAGAFTAVVAGILLICFSRLREPFLKEDERPLVKRLSASIVLMFMGQVQMIPLMLHIGLTRTIDVWHIAIFIVMALAYTSLRGLVSEPASAHKQAMD